MANTQESARSSSQNIREMSKREASRRTDRKGGVIWRNLWNPSVIRVEASLTLHLDYIHFYGREEAREASSFQAAVPAAAAIHGPALES